MVFHSPFLEEIREEGREEGRLLSIRENILDALTERFDPPAKVYRAIERDLAKIADYDTLRSLFTLTLRVATVDEFVDAVGQQNAEQ